jgi:hypothetical protein
MQKTRADDDGRSTTVISAMMTIERQSRGLQLNSFGLLLNRKRLCTMHVTPTVRAKQIYRPAPPRAPRACMSPVPLQRRFRKWHRQTSIWTHREMFVSPKLDAKPSPDFATPLSRICLITSSSREVPKVDSSCCLDDFPSLPVWPVVEWKTSNAITI